MIKVIVDNVTFDPQSSLYKVSLKDEKSGKVLPIFVGTFEGNAIALGLRNVPTVRPMTHDLMKNMIERLYGKIKKIVVADLKENIYYGFIYIDLKDTELAIDARPSDAIALATRAKVPIYVSEKLHDKFVDEYEEILAGMDPGETVH